MKDKFIEVEKGDLPIDLGGKLYIPKLPKFSNLPEIFTRWFYQNHQTFYDRKISPFSYRIAKKIKAERNRCHFNCAKILENEHEKYQYYVGHAILLNHKEKTREVTNQHSWLLSENRIIDPTLAIPTKMRKKNNGKIEKITRNVKPQDHYLKDYNIQYLGVEIPSKIFFDIKNFKETHNNFQNSHYLEEFFLIEELGIPISEACKDIGFGKSAAELFDTNFKIFCKEFHEQKINDYLKEREEESYNNFLNMMDAFAISRLETT